MRWLAIAVLLMGCGKAPVDPCAGRSCAPPPAVDAGWAMPGADAAMPMPEADAGTDASSPWTLDPSQPPPAPGCDQSSIDCDTWERDLFTRLVARRQGCSSALTIDAGAQAVAERHALHQATEDRLTGSSPEGNLFAQVQAEGSSFHDSGALFSTTRTGPDDVVGRWASNPSLASLITGCFDRAGIAFHTSASGASYVTVILLRD